MPTEDQPFLSDLRRQFYGGSTVSERDALKAASDAGIRFVDLVTAAQNTQQAGGQTADLTAYIATHDANAAAHAGVVRWKETGKETHGIYYRSTTPPADPGSIWFQIA